MQQLSLEKAKEYFDDEYFSRGMNYYKKGMIIQSSIDNGVIISKVKGSYNNNYKQKIRIDNGTVDGYCTCPIGINCKHVAAVIIKYFKDNNVISANNNITSPVKQISDTVSPMLKDWLDDFDKSVSKLDVNYNVNAKRILVYVLKYDQIDNKKKLSILTRSAPINKDGTYGDFIDYRINNSSSYNFPAYFSIDDINIIKKLSLFNRYEAEVKLEGDIGASIINTAVETGRLYWGSEAGTPLTFGKAEPFNFAWVLAKNGRQSLNAVCNNKELQVLPIIPTYYIDVKNNIIGIAENNIPNSVKEKLFSLPPLNEKEAELVRESLSKYNGFIEIAPAPKLEHKIIKNIKPIPCLQLCHKNVFYSYDYNKNSDVHNLFASLSFDYNGNMVEYGDKNEVVTQVNDNILTEITRSSRYEIAALNTVLKCGLIPSDKAAKMYDGYSLSNRKDNYFAIVGYGIREKWIDFILDTIPELRNMGWRIEIDDNFPIKPSILNDDITFNINDNNDGVGNDWFNFNISTNGDNGQLNLLPILANFVSQLNDDLFVDFMDADDDSRLSIKLNDNGDYAVIETGRIKTILQFLRDIWHVGKLNINENGLSLSRSEAILLADTEAASESAKLRWFGGERLRDTIAKLRDFKEILPVKPSSQFMAELRPYQQEGLNWLGFLREYKFGGILADDMGLGKTIQTLSWISLEKEEGRLNKPCLVICPTSLIYNWQQEAQKFAPSLSVLPLQGKDRKDKFTEINNHDIILTTYPLLPRDKEILIEQDFYAVILDEAQFIKNTKAHMTQIVHQLKAQHRLCLTGTPVENHLGEMWSLFNFLQPGLLGDEKYFNAAYRKPIEKEGNKDRQEALKRRIRPFILRRLKENVATELPPKTEIIRTVAMDKIQSDLYETIRLSMHNRVRDEIASKGMARSHIIVLDALLKLRQICCDPRLLKTETVKKTKSGSAKIEMLMEMLPSLIEEGRKILLFSQFTEMLELIESACNENKIPYVKLTGQTTNRKDIINQFQNGDVPLFLISLKAGGTGLNLTAADTVIHYDPWWNPAVERQATDRAHRIGQEKPVFVYKLITAGTVEEKILELQKRKQEIADVLFNNTEAGNAKLTENDISVLFER